jgi:acetylornithine deacetylase/succinyl-diaminopimelate desuccinylase-like protein
LDHTPNEHISLEDYSKSVRVLLSALRKLVE